MVHPDSHCPLHRLFFAVQPTAEARAAICLVRDEVVPRSKRVADGRLHVTMGISEDFPAFPHEVAERMKAIGAAVRAPPARVAFDQLFVGQTFAALRARRKLSELHVLYRELDGLLLREGIRRPGWSYNPHVTLGYAGLRPNTRTIAPIGWDASEFVLIHSLIGETRHTVLGRWPLVAQQYDLFA